MSIGIVRAWLESLNLGQYIGQFLEHNIDTLEQCSVLDDQTLQEVGVSLVGHRKRILNHLPTVDEDVYVNENLVVEKFINNNVPSISPQSVQSRMGDSLYLSNSDTSLSSLEGVIHSQSSRENSPVASQTNSDGLMRPVPKPRKKAKRPTPKPRISSKLLKESVKLDGATECASTTDDSPDLCDAEESSQTFQMKYSVDTKALQSSETKLLKNDPPYVNVVKGSNSQVVFVEEAHAKDDEISQDRECSIYEPIWDDNSSPSTASQGTIDRAGNIRTSIPMDLSLLTPNLVDSVNLRSINANLEDNVDQRRYSSVFFDIPPPEFPPPPLPSDISRADVLADFDPLSCPPIPPRPDNQPKKTIQKYENFKLNTSHFAQADSQTLPPTINEEPGMDEDIFFREMSSSLRGNVNVNKNPFQNNTFENCELSVSLDPLENTDPFQRSDPFHRSDPFGSFKADDYQDFEMKVKNSLSQKTSDHQSQTLQKSCSENPVYEDPIYEDPSFLPDKGTDLNGLKKFTNSHSAVRQSTSRSQSIRLSHVMPPPDLRVPASFDDMSGTQVSKRIVPLSIMKEVKQEIYVIFTNRKSSLGHHGQSGAKLYKFLVITKNRTYHFATDDSNDCMLWASTIMHAIIEYQPPPGGVKEGGDMHDPDLQGWIKFDGKNNKYLVAIKNQRLCYYNSGEDFKLGTPVHDIEMKLAAVKEIDKTKLQLSTHYCHFMLQFERSHDALKWRMALEESIADALGDNKVLNEVIENHYNKKCADCDATNPHWSSINLGIVLCKKCAGIHREFQSSLSKVRSLRMDTSVWTPSLIKILKVIGNKNANDFWAKHTTSKEQIKDNSLPEVRQKFIHQKYREKKFCKLHPLSQDKDSLNMALLESVKTDDVLTTMEILFSGADTPSCLKTCRPKLISDDFFLIPVLDVAREAKQNLQAEFLLQNGGDCELKRMKICHQGYLYKTGPNMKDFLKRWCVVEHGCISYFVDEKSTVFKDRVDSDFLLSIQDSNRDRLKTVFEVSTKKHNRIYLFKTESEEEKVSWMQVFSQLFCPVELMETMKKRKFILAGMFYMKHGLSMEWQRTWMVIEGRTLFYTQQDVTSIEEEEADLRKMTSLTKIADSLENDGGCISSHCLLVSFFRALYIQADLVRDTERLFSCLDVGMKRGGDFLDDQPLTADDVPVLVEHCIDLIERRALTTQGIYREARTSSVIQKMLDQFKEDARSVALTDETDVHVVANVIKRFFRNLDDPLLTSRLYKHFTQTAALGEIDVKDQWYKYLLQQLPRVNYQTLKRLASHLWRLSTHSRENLMKLENIATSFGSTLMKSNKDDNQPMSAIGHGVQLEMQVISDIVSNYQQLFDVISINTTAEDIVKMMKSKLNIQTGVWYLHEVLCNGSMERPLHPKQNVMSVLKTWWTWHETHYKRAFLCLKNRDLMDSITQSYNPGQPLFAEFKFTEDNKTKKYAFDFSQSKLSCYKDMKKVRESEVSSLCFSYLLNSLMNSCPSKNTMGRTVWCSSEADLLKWMAAMMKAQFSC
ncbi:hypothetical protein ACJMK2_032749 [Sinanodonta woodiana]|uniref:Arf-GAP with Rho-GAP domain, ANK repeat and PH domain-containing protein 2 n=1 Tax=Sinanodonta woodiana TaxID=1069815 RepID=A0ABD3X477_SINWO